MVSGCQDFLRTEGLFNALRGGTDCEALVVILIEEEEMRPIMEPHPGSLLALLGSLPDRRRRQGMEYPLAAVLGMLVLAAINGENSLRGMCLWARARWGQIWTDLGFLSPKMPGLSTVWTIMAGLDTRQLEVLLAAWIEMRQGQDNRRVSIDGKTLRGSRRHHAEALHVVEAVGQELNLVLGERQSAQGEDLAAALALLQGLPLEGRVVTADAGLLQREVVQTVLGRGGDYLGVVKENQPELKAAVDEWVREDVSPPRDDA
jgi:hypothetical protein